MKRKEPLARSVEELATENLLLENEVHTARRAADITAKLVVEQFQKMESVQALLEEKAAAERLLHRQLADELRERKLVQEEVRRNYEIQTALNELLRLSLTDLPQKELLTAALSLILSVPCLAFQPRGAIFLADPNSHSLVLTAQVDPDGSEFSACGRIPFRHCLCGRAAAEQKVVYAASLADARHEVRSEGGPDHGHYCVPLLAADKVLGVLTIFLDADHPRAAAEESFLKACTDILASIIERTSVTEKLREAMTAADAANRAKSTFLANMSHELRTPMNAIIGYSEMLAEEAEDCGYDSFVSDLNKINSAGKHLLALINDILDFSKIEAGKIELYLETFDVRTMIREVTDTIRPLVEKNANRLEIRCPAEIGALHADLTKMRQTLFNLLSNACKFTKDGLVTLEVTHGVDEASGEGWFSFAIADTGIGMSAEQMAKLFQAFSQGDASTTKKYGGTGLGLSISRHFCQIMGGDITVESEPGKGSVFTAKIPDQVVIQTEAAPEAEASLPRRGTDGAGRLVLVIDDDTEAREILIRSLRQELYEIASAAGGEEGLRLARELKPDVIVLDVLMPTMDGWMVLTTLKADPELAEIPVVMLTMLNDEHMGLALGASDYLTKPINRDRLTAVLRKHLPDQGSGNILVVEDDPITRDMMKHLLEKEGYAVTVANNGKLGMEQALATQPALVLLDLMMPEMDGFQFVEELRDHEELKATPVVVVTAKDLTNEDRLRLHGYVKLVLQKGSYSRDDLLTELRGLVAAHAGPARPAAPRVGPAGGAKVLVIDDDPKIHELMLRLLAKEGFEVAIARTGKEGVRLAHEFQPSVITLDVLMPDMDGWTVLSSLKSDPAIADIPVVMLTVIDDRNLGFTLGASDFLNKPIDRSRLLRVLEKYTVGEGSEPVLIVEDDPQTRQVLRRIIEKECRLVLEAENGRQALERIAETRPALILLDLMMPEVDGFELLEELRGREETRSIPVVVVTAKDLTAEERRRLDGSVQRIMQKGSYTKDDLLNEVRRIALLHASATGQATP